MKLLCGPNATNPEQYTCQGQRLANLIGDAVREVITDAIRKGVDATVVEALAQDVAKEICLDAIIEKRRQGTQQEQVPTKKEKPMLTDKEKPEETEPELALFASIVPEQGALVLFENIDTFTPPGQALYRSLVQALSPIFREMVSQGADPREMTTVARSCANKVCLRELLLMPMHRKQLKEAGKEKDEQDAEKKDQWDGSNGQ